MTKLLEVSEENFKLHPIFPEFCRYMVEGLPEDHKDFYFHQFTDTELFAHFKEFLGD